MGNAEQESSSFSPHGWLWVLLSLFIAVTGRALSRYSSLGLSLEAQSFCSC